MNETLKPVCPHNPDIECPCPKDCPRHGKCCATPDDFDYYCCQAIGDR